MISSKFIKRVKQVVLGRVDPIRHIMLNRFYGSCRVTREIIVFMSCLELRPVNINGSLVLTDRKRVMSNDPFCQPYT
jgi:hypothetical protein